MRRHAPLLLLALLLLAPASAAPDPRFDPAGAWTVVGNGGGVLELHGRPDALVALRRSGARAERGRATFDGARLVVAWATSSGFTSVLGGGGAAGERRSVYVLDRVEAAFRGRHDGREESLRRPIPGNAVDLLVDGREMLPRYLTAIREARHHVHVECYLWADDPAANGIADALIARARAGVRVRAIFDAQGSGKTDRLRDRLRRGGVAVVHYNPLGLSSIVSSLVEVWDVLRGKRTLRDVGDGRLAKAYDNRDHRKVLVVDGRVAFLGGICNTQASIHEWHDVHARLRGPAVASVQRHFIDAWYAGGGARITDEPRLLYPELRRAGDLAVDVTTTVPGVRDEVRRLYHDRLRGARREILLENPYFADAGVEAELIAAARRGVKVTLILPDDDVNDVSIMAAYHSTVRGKLSLAGVDVRSYPKMAHGKVGVVDGRWATVGSTNLDNRSFARDLEENLSIDDPRFAAVVKARVFDPDVRVSRRWTFADRPTSLLKRAYGFVAAALRDWL